MFARQFAAGALIVAFAQTAVAQDIVIANGEFVQYDTTLGTLVANLGYDEVNFPAPVFVGDTLTCETEVLALRESKSRPNAGIVTWEHRAKNQDGKTVCTFKRSALLKKSDA